MFWFSGAAVLSLVLTYAIVVALLVWIGFLVIRAAVRGAMDDHYRKLQWYQQTGLWYSGRPPKGLPGTQELTRAQRKDLPKTERPE